MRANAATAVCRCLPFKVLMPFLNMLFPLLGVIYQIFPFPRKWAAKNSVPYRMPRGSLLCLDIMPNHPPPLDNSRTETQDTTGCSQTHHPVANCVPKSESHNADAAH